MRKAILNVFLIKSQMYKDKSKLPNFLSLLQYNISNTYCLTWTSSKNQASMFGLDSIICLRSQIGAHIASASTTRCEYVDPILYMKRRSNDKWIIIYYSSDSDVRCSKSLELSVRCELHHLNTVQYIFLFCKEIQ